ERRRLLPQRGAELAEAGRRGALDRHVPRRRPGDAGPPPPGLAHHRPGRIVERGLGHAPGRDRARRRRRDPPPRPYRRGDRRDGPRDGPRRGGDGRPEPDPSGAPMTPSLSTQILQIPVNRPESRMSTEPVLTEHKVTVLLIDDQPMIGEAVRRMLAGEPDIVFNYCRDAAKALDEAHRVQPTVILQDLVMPEIDGLTLVKTFRANEATRETPMIVLSTKEEPTVKAEAFALGANDYIVKLPDRIELLARIRYHSKGYINLLQRNEAYEALKESERRLAGEINQAARYVRSLLPEKLKKRQL